AQSAINWLAFNYAASPATFGSFDMSASPVKYNGNDVVLSAMTGVTSNYPDGAVQTAFETALRDQAVPGADVGMTYGVTATLQSMQLIFPFGSSVQKPLQSWVIRSQGSVAGSQAQVEVTTTIERMGRGVFSFAAFSASQSCGAL